MDAAERFSNALQRKVALQGEWQKAQREFMLAMKEFIVSDSTFFATTREKQVLFHVINGLTNKEIANNLNITERTVKFHVSHLLAKYGVDSRMKLQMDFAD